jgi:hypothetical protein
VSEAAPKSGRLFCWETVAFIFPPQIAISRGISSRDMDLWEGSFGFLTRTLTMPTKLPDTGKKKWVRNVQLARYFNISAMCLWRWKRDPALNCPPSYEVNGLEWNDIDEWERWMRSRAVNHIDAAMKKNSRAERLAKGRARKQKVA